MKTGRMVKVVGMATVLFCISLQGIASPVGVYVNDNFSSPTLDPAVWTTHDYGGSYSTATGELKLTANYAVSSVPMVSPDAGQTVTTSVTNLWTDQYNLSQRWGLQNSDASNSILLFQDRLPETKGIRMRITKDSAMQETMLSTSQIAGLYAIEWEQGSVILRNSTDGGANWTTLFDSSVNTPDGGGAWNIPTVDMGIYAEAWLNSNELYIDGAKLEVVPEPATLCLLGLGAVFVSARNRRR